MIRILLADDHEESRRLIRRLVTGHQNIDIIAEASNGKETIDLTQQWKPDVLVIDITMPMMNGMDATTLLTARIPGLKVITLTGHADIAYIQGMLQAGALGYVLKSDMFEDLIPAIVNVAAGKRYFSITIQHTLASSSHPSSLSTTM